MPRVHLSGLPRAIGPHRQQDKIDEAFKKLSELVGYIQHTLGDVAALMSDACNTGPDPGPPGTDNHQTPETEPHSIDGIDRNPVHDHACQQLLSDLGFIPDTPGVPGLTPQPPIITAQLDHPFIDNTTPVPNAAGSESAVVPVRAFSFPNIATSHEVIDAADAPGQFSVTVTLQNLSRCLGQYSSKPQAHFAVRFAILLSQILTPSQQKQRDIILDPSQVTKITELECDYDFDGRTKDEIKEDIALHLLNNNQTLIWTSPPVLGSQMQINFAALAKENWRGGFPRRSDTPCLGH